MTNDGEIKMRLVIDDEQVKEAAALAASLFRSTLAVSLLEDEGDHEHEWKRQQNVTSKGTPMRVIEVCACGRARPAEEEGPDYEALIDAVREGDGDIQLNSGVKIAKCDTHGYTDRELSLEEERDRLRRLLRSAQEERESVGRRLNELDQRHRRLVQDLTGVRSMARTHTFADVIGNEIQMVLDNDRRRAELPGGPA